MAVSIKPEGGDNPLLIDPKTELITCDGDENVDFLDYNDTLEIVGADGLADKLGSGLAALEKLPRPCSALNCRQARSYLVKLLRYANGGQNPQYGNPGSKPPFWPDFYWPWEKLTDVHTKPRGMEEPLQYSEMMKLAIERGYKYYGLDPETYWDRTVEECEPSPVVRGTPAPILEHQVEKLGEPPRLPRPNSQLNCVQARTVLSKLLRYQQAGNNPVYGHPETRPPWWPDDCIRWIDMVDLRGKPPYLPKDMSYTDVLKMAIERGLRYFGYDAETWVDETTFHREQNVSFLSKLNKISTSCALLDEVPRLPIPINKMNCSVARTSLARLLRFHCGANPKYGLVETMPVWWPNEVFEWTALKNLSHRFEGFMGDSYSNCLRLALAHGYDYYGKDPLTYVEEMAENLPVVSNKRMTPFQINPQVSELLNKFEKNIDALDLAENGATGEDEELSGQQSGNRGGVVGDVVRKKRPPPMLIPIAAVLQFSEHGLDSLKLAECLVGTPTDAAPALAAAIVSTTTNDKVVLITESSTEITNSSVAKVNGSVSEASKEPASPTMADSAFSEQAIPITPMTVPPEQELTDEFAEDSSSTEGETDQLVVVAEPLPPPSAEKETKKRKVEMTPKIERVKRKRTTMSVKKDDD